MKFSVVIPTYNRADTLRLTVRSVLAQQTELLHEVVVVDNNSTDHTRQAVEDLARDAPAPIRYVFEPIQGSSAARNAGVHAACGDVIAFLDDDVVAAPDWLAALADAYTQVPDAWAIGGRVDLRLPGPPPPWLDLDSELVRAYLSHQHLGDGLIRVNFPAGLITANLSVRAWVLRRLGDFDPLLGRFGTDLLCGEDIEFCYRIQAAGGTVYYCSRAVVTHLIPPDRLKKAFFRGRADGEGRTQALFHLRSGPVSASGAPREAAIALKDLAKYLYHVGRGSPREAFACELAVIKRVGYLRQLLRSRARQNAWGLGGRTVRVARVPEDALDRLAPEWAALADASESTIFQTFEWLATWWEVYGHSRTLYLLEARTPDGTLVGLAPLCLETLPELSSLRVLRFLASGPSDYLDFIVAPGFERLAARAFASFLLDKRSDWDLIDLHDVPARSASAPAFLEVMSERGAATRKALHHRCYSIALPDTFEAYLATLGRSTRKHLLRAQRVFEQHGAWVEALRTWEELEAGFGPFVELHKLRWNARGGSAAFADPATVQFYRRAVRRLAPLGRVAIRFLRCGDVRIAALFEFRFRGTVYDYLGGFDPETRWSRYSPGSVLLLHNLKSAHAEGVRTYDLLRGAEPYKRAFGGREHHTFRYLFVSPTPRARVGYAALQGLRFAQRLRRRLVAGDGARG